MLSDLQIEGPKIVKPHLHSLLLNDEPVLAFYMVGFQEHYSISAKTLQHTQKMVTGTSTSMRTRKVCARSSGSAPPAPPLSPLPGSSSPPPPASLPPLCAPPMPASEQARPALELAFVPSSPVISEEWQFL
jgi:hypothetical protein